MFTKCWLVLSLLCTLPASSPDALAAAPVVDSVDRVATEQSPQRTTHVAIEPAEDVATELEIHSAAPTLAVASTVTSKGAARGPMSLALLAATLLGCVMLTQRRSA